jgi:hypothetical protein
MVLLSVPAFRKNGAGHEGLPAGAGSPARPCLGTIETCGVRAFSPLDRVFTPVLTPR